MEDSNGFYNLLGDTDNMMQQSRSGKSRSGISVLPRIVPRKMKGKLRKSEGYGSISPRGKPLERGRISVYANYRALSLHALNDRLGDGSSGRRYSSIGDMHYHPEISRPAASTPKSGMRDKNRCKAIDPSWRATMYFDVLHMTRPRLSRAPTPNPLLSFDENQEDVLYQRQSSENDLADVESEDDGGASSLKSPGLLGEGDDRMDVFLFSFGCGVFWNFDVKEEMQFMTSLREFSEQEYIDSDLIDNANDDMQFQYGSKSSVRHDIVRLSSRKVEEKIAVSYAFAQSSLLSIYEWRLDKIIQRNEKLPQELAVTGSIKMPMKAINKEIGCLFMERNSINLESDLLGKPDFFWENDEWDPLYQTMCEYLEKEERMDVITKRMECVHELLDVLTSQAENRHASRLEWIVIWLVASEVFIQLFWNILIKDILKFFPDCT